MNIEKKLSSVKKVFRELIRPITGFLARLDVNPNYLTVMSFLGALIASVEFARGSLRAAAAWLLLGGLFDILDGEVARGAKRSSRFGALLDSTLDRYSEGIVLCSIGFYFFKTGGVSDRSLIFLAGLSMALIGSLMVSYVRARCEGLGIECQVGVMQRPERVVLLAIGSLISPTALALCIFIIAAMTNYTTVQRVRFASNQLKQSDHSGEEQS